MTMLEIDDTRPVLVIDLDGTLIRSDMLYECFWTGFSRNWRTPLWAVAGLTRGRAALKERMALCGAPDPATLPYTPEVLEHIRDWRASGGRTALVTAADQSLADAIGAHLGLFDEIHGSDGETNLKGAKKAALLIERFGAGGYIYAGDSSADLPVWQEAAGAVTVGLNAALRGQVEAQHPGSTHLAPPKSVLPAALRAMRPHQWLKNLLVFFPLVAAHHLLPLAIWQATVAFVAFSLVASSVYLLNDLLDLGSDRMHPRKRNRPLASGALPLRHGMMLVPVLLCAGLAMALLLAPLFLLVLTVYYLLTISYSLWLKRRPIIDICTLASLYTLRMAAGAAATGITLSVWLLAFSAFLFFSLAAVKRQAELVDMVHRGIDEIAGRGYRVGDLAVVTQMAVASGFASVVVLMLYLNEPTVQQLYRFPVLIWVACLILLYWNTRMILKAQRGEMDDDPVVFTARDPVSRMAFVLIVGLFLAAGYL
ncbi:UbiA family prenyltransferase [Pararhodobacter oceanensis]|uniref:UbiA family prenyltransferase n=1 Tax=Pararhodobacter oceanensis TaxID=2172121 RepID=UPI003A948BEB